jgi:hypothetical protein
MAIISGVKYTVNVIGNTYISDVDYSNQYVPTSKRELTFDNITNANGEIPISLVGMDLLTTVILQSDRATVKLYNTSGAINTIDVSGFLLYELDPVIASGIINATISTRNTTGMSVSVTLVGAVTV